SPPRTPARGRPLDETDGPAWEGYLSKLSLSSSSSAACSSLLPPVSIGGSSSTISSAIISSDEGETSPSASDALATSTEPSSGASSVGRPPTGTTLTVTVARTLRVTLIV